MSEWDIFGCNRSPPDGGLKYHKVNGEENPSDACTKHLTGERLRKLVARAGQCQRSGRAQESLRVQPARTAPADSPGCLKQQGEGQCQHISTPSRGLSPDSDPVAVYCARTLARLQKFKNLMCGFVPYLPNSRHVQHSQHSTPQIHNKSWRSGNVHHFCLGGGPHGWVPVNKHSTPVLPKWEEAAGSSQAPQPNKPNTHKSHAQLPHGGGARATIHSTTRNRRAPD